VCPSISPRALLASPQCRYWGCSDRAVGRGSFGLWTMKRGGRWREGTLHWFKYSWRTEAWGVHVHTIYKECCTTLEKRSYKGRRWSTHIHMNGRKHDAKYGDWSPVFQLKVSYTWVQHESSPALQLKSHLSVCLPVYFILVNWFIRRVHYLQIQTLQVTLFLHSVFGIVIYLLKIKLYNCLFILPFKSLWSVRFFFFYINQIILKKVLKTTTQTCCSYSTIAVIIRARRKKKVYKASEAISFIHKYIHIFLYYQLESVGPFSSDL